MMNRILAFVSVSLLAGFANAALLPPDAQVEEVTDFSGGLNTSVPSHKLKNNFSPALRNGYIDEEFGTFLERLGFAAVGSTPTLQDIRFGITFYKEDGSKEYILSDSSIVLTTTDFNHFTLIQSTLTTTVNLHAKQVRNKIWFTNGIDDVFNWDGTQKLILPFVPKGSYIDYYQERVWMYNTSANGSSLDYSALITTENIIIAPDDSRAWPASNSLNVGRGDGQVGTGLIVYGGQLRALKDESIYTIFGNNDTNYVARKTDAESGVVSQDSLVNMDGVVYGLGSREVYQFTGSKTDSISELIRPDVDDFRKDSVRIQENVWDSQSEFGQGDFHGSTATADGFVNQFSTDGFHILMTSFSASPGASVTLDAGTTFFGDVNASFLEFPSIDQSSSARTNRHLKGYVTQVNAGINGGTGGGVHPITRLSIRNSRTGVEHSTTFPTGLATQYNEVFFSSQSPVFDGFDLIKDSMVVKVELTNADGLNTVQVLKTSWLWRLRQATTVQYTSEVSTFSTFSFWDRFDSDFTTNGGSVTYYVRGSNILATISTKTWTSITPGVIVPLATSSTYFQFASTLTAISTSAYPSIDFVSVRRIAGNGSITRAFATNWRNRYWLAVSTESTGDYPLIYVKSKQFNPTPNAWTVFDSHPIRCFFKDGEDVLYAGHSSTGTIFRLDFGTNDNGAAIPDYYDTPDMYFDSDFLDKKLYEVWVDAGENTGGTFTLSISTDGAGYRGISQSIDGTDRRILQFKNVSSTANTFRFRASTPAKDIRTRLHGIAPIYIPQKIRAER